MDASDYAAWIGAITGSLSLLVEAHEAFVNRAEIKIKLSKNFASLVTPGNYLQQEYLPEIQIAILNIEFVNKGQQEITLNGIKAYNFAQKTWVRISKTEMKFKTLSLKKMDNKDPHVYSFNPMLAPIVSLPLRVKANDMKVFQISLLASEYLSHNRVRLNFELPGKSKKITLKIPSLLDFLHSEGYKLFLSN